MDVKKIKKVLNNKMMQLHDIVADMDGLLTELEDDYYRVSIFGSARIQENSDIYKQCYQLAFELGKEGADIVTGGGPGLMEAANKGSQDASNATRSIGLAIELPFESDANQHLDIKHEHKRFSSRLDEFMRLSHSIVVMPGGLGTVLELVYTWQLIQVGHIKPRPMILLGKDMWGGLVDWIKSVPTQRNLMSESDFDCLKITDSVEETIDFLRPDITKFNQARLEKIKQNAKK